MAESGTGQPTTIQCGYCLVKDDQMNDPRILPCSHVFCTSCMIGQYEDVGVVTCPTCSTTFEGDINSLPRNETQSSTQLCDICLKENGTENAATSFCTTCSKKLCKEHQRYHDLIIDGHVTVSIETFKAEESKLKIRNCSEHGGHRYILGCQVCRKVLCSRCLTSTNLCDNDKHHELIHLDELESMLKTTFGKGCENVAANEECIAKLYKEFSKMVSEYQVETTEMVSLLQSTRDKQIQIITAKYKLIEEELVQLRTKVQKQMETFMEEEVNDVLSALSSQRKRIEDKYRSSHQVDVVLEHDSTLAKLKELADIMVKDCKVLHVKLESNPEGSKEPEVHLAADNDMYIGYRGDVLEKWAGPPKSLKFSKSVNVPSFCHSICCVNGKCCIGTEQNTVEVVNDNLTIKRFISTQGYPYGIIHDDSKIYTMSTSNNNRITVASYNYLGHTLSTWTPNGTCHYIRPAIVSSQLIVPDPTNSRVTVYSLSGGLIKHITGLKISGEGTAITAVGNNSVVVTCYKLSSVFKVNVETGKVMWTCSGVSQPHGVAVYNQDYVCVVSSRKLSFINITNGAVEKVFSEPKIGVSSHKMDIEIFKTTAAVSSNSGLHLFEFGH